MRLIRALAVIAFALAFATPAGASDGWRIVESAGAVKAGGSGVTPVAVSSNQTLPADSWVETAATGRAVLVRGAESIAVGPNSRVQLPSLEVNGNTQVLQTLGSALYQIGKQQKPHFQVDTPYLAAVVKGTTFTVTVEQTASAVQVTEGLVEVATPDHADVEFVRPGFTGIVSSDHRSNVVIVRSENAGLPALPKNVAPGDKAKSKSTSNGAGTKFASASSGGRIVIANTIGDVKVDVKSVSGGLASGATEPVASSSAGDSAITKTTSVVTSVTTGVTGVVGETASATPVTSPAVEVGPATAAVDVGTGATGGGSVAVGVGSVANVDVSVGGASGTGSGSGGVSVGVGVAGVGVGVGVGVGNGGGGTGVSVGLGNLLGIHLGLGGH